MCERYALTSSREALAALIGAVAGDQFSARYNISPGQAVQAVAGEKGRRPMSRYRWGLAPAHGEEGHGSLVFNARVEGAAQKPLFAGALQARRCLVPANAWYVWKTIGRFKQPYVVRRLDREPVFFAAVWDRWLDRDEKEGRALAIFTRPATPGLAEVDERMPVVVEAEFWDAWLDPRIDGASLLARRLKPARGGVYEASPIGARINQLDADGPELQEPAPAPAPSEAAPPRLI